MKESHTEEEYSNLPNVKGVRNRSWNRTLIGYPEKENYRNYKPFTHIAAFLLQK
jgi:hypothetical protein